MGAKLCYIPLPIICDCDATSYAECELVRVSTTVMSDDNAGTWLAAHGRVHSVSCWRLMHKGRLEAAVFLLYCSIVYDLRVLTDSLLPVDAPAPYEACGQPRVE